MSLYFFCEQNGCIRKYVRAGNWLRHMKNVHGIEDLAPPVPREYVEEQKPLGESSTHRNCGSSVGDSCRCNCSGSKVVSSSSLLASIVPLPEAITTAPVAASGRDECIICMDAKINTAFIPCGHVACCTACANTLTRCPICRCDIEKTLRLFFS